MAKYVAYGEVTFTSSIEPFSVILTNEAQQIVTNSSRTVQSKQTYYTDVIVFRGAEERTDFTIGNISSVSNITVSKSGNRVTFTVNSGVTLQADSGTFDIPVILDDKTVTKTFSWSCAKQGSDGSAAKLVDITSSSQVFKSTDGGVSFVPETITLTPTFQGGITYSKWQYSLDGGSSWNNASNSTNDITIASSGVLTLSCTSTLFTDSITSIPFKCISSDTSFYDITTIFKIYDVKDIGVGGRNLLLKSKDEKSSTFNKSEYSSWNKSSEVLLEKGDSYVLSFYAKTPTAKDKIYLSFANSGSSKEYITPNNLMIDTIDYKLYKIYGRIGIDSFSWDSVLFSNNNGWNSLSGNTGTVYIKQIKLEKGTLATDYTEAPEDVDSRVDDVIETVQQVSLIVDQNNKSITGKVWQDDITKKINDYDSSTVEATRSRLSQLEQDVDGFKTTVSNDFTDFDKKITSAKTVAEQTSEKFSWLVESGDSSSNFTLTDRAAQLVAEYINMKGTVTFSAFDSDVTNRMNRYEGWSAENDVTKIDGGMIYTHSITADQLSADSIKAYRLQIGDIINYATVNENDKNTMLSSTFKYGQTNILEGTVCKQLKSSRYLMMCDYGEQIFKQGDEIYYQFTMYSRYGAYIYPAYFGLDADYNIITVCQGEYYSIDLDFNNYKGTIKLDVDLSNDVYYLFGFYDETEDKALIYVKDTIFRKASGNVIIEDGSITADKIASKSVTADKIDATNLVISQTDDDGNGTGIDTLAVDSNGNISMNVTSLKIVSADGTTSSNAASMDDVDDIVNLQVSALETKIENSEIWMNFGQVQQESSETSETTTLWKKYIKISDGEMTFGRNTDDDGNPIDEKDTTSLTLSNNEMNIKRGGTKKMILNEENLFITSATITESLSIGGNYIIQPRQSGGVAFFKI